MDTAARHLERDGVNGALTWTSEYGSVVAGAFDMISVDGLNEAGLAGHVLWLAESDYDATGDSCIIEYREGKPKVFHSRDYVVMTNSPTYDKQLELAKMITGLGGDQPIPGSTLASDRFARASYYVSRLERPKTELQAVAGMFSVIRNAAQPFRAPDLGKPEASQTLWQTVSDPTNKWYVFASTTCPNVVWVELDQIDFTEGTPQLKLDLVDELAIQHGIAGDVSDKFEDKGNFNFLTMAMEKQLLDAADTKAAE